MSAASLPVSVIVGTIEAWPEVRPCLDRLIPQVEAAGGELLLADGTRDGAGGPPAGVSGYETVKIVTSPGASIFALRARGAEKAAGEYLAFTEDHCIPDARWLAQILEAFRAHPEAQLVSGPVTNGSSDGLIDWANFLMTFAEFMPSAVSRPVKRVPPMGNCSFRRSVLIGGELPEGWLELVLAPTLVHPPRLCFDTSIVVSHVQPRSLRAAWAAHFHNGRSCAGLARPHMARRDWGVRLATVPAMPLILYVSVLRSLTGRVIPRRARLSLAAMWLLCAAHACGELTGLILGEGTSAKRLN